MDRRDRIRKRLILIFAAIVILFAVTMVFRLCHSFNPFPPDALPGVSIGADLLSDFETSDIVWHPRLDTLLLVSDRGSFASMDIEGKTITILPAGGDLEAIAIARPESDFVYLGRERTNSICEFNIATGNISREFQLSRWMKCPENRGMEALTFIPDANDPEGGLFYVGLQDTGEILVFRLPIASSLTNTEVTYIQTIPSFKNVDDISGLSYSASQGVIYAIYDDSNLLRAMTIDGTVICEWDLPGKHQEGIALKDDALYICQDNGHRGSDVIRYAPFPGVLPALQSRGIER